MATQPSQSASNIVQDARQLVAQGKKQLPAIVAADKARGKTMGFGMAALKQLEADIDAFDGAAATKEGTTTAVRAATKGEVGARAALAAELQRIRDDVKDALGDDRALCRAFGVGTRLSTQTTNKLLEAADAVRGAFPQYAARVGGAGVTKARMARLGALRGQLAASDATQRAGQGDERVATRSKAALLAAIKKGATRLRARLAKAAPSAAGAVTGQARGAKRAVTPAKRAAPLKSSSARHKVKKRAPKPTS